MNSVFAVTKRPNERVVGIHETRQSAEGQAVEYTRELGEEFGVVEWIIRKDVI
jgi:hypothetical protein